MATVLGPPQTSRMETIAKYLALALLCSQNKRMALQLDYTESDNQLTALAKLGRLGSAEHGANGVKIRCYSGLTCEPFSLQLQDCYASTRTQVAQVCEGH